jgi:hypothetical protein
MTSPVCICGHSITDHPEPISPTPLYRLARKAFVSAIGDVIYLPGISNAHRNAIMRARLERRVGGA